MQTINFVSRYLISNILEGAVGSKGLSGRRSLVIAMCPVGQTLYSQVSLCAHGIIDYLFWNIQ